MRLATPCSRGADALTSCVKASASPLLACSTKSPCIDVTASADDVPTGFSANPATDTEIRTFGIEYKPLTQLVVKIDYQDLQNEARTGYSQFNVGMGYVF